MRLIWKIRGRLGLIKEDCEYWVYTNDIIVPEEYKKSHIRKEKWEHKLDYWRKTGEFESKIFLDRDFNLVDGYSSVKIAYLNGIEKVPVQFVSLKS